MAPKVLIVDDSKLARMVIAKALGSLQPGWLKVEAANADEAETMLDAGGIDVLILDFNMPGRSGLDLAQAIRPRFPTLPIALVTANHQDSIIGLARSFDLTFVPKPLSEESLRGFLTDAAARTGNP